MLAFPNINPNVRNGIGDLPLHTYVKKGLSAKMELLVTLLSSGLNVKINALNADGNTALHIAAQVRLYSKNICVYLCNNNMICLVYESITSSL